MKKQQKQKTENKGLKKISVLIALFVLLSIILGSYFYIKVTNVQTVKIDKSDSALGIKTTSTEDYEMSEIKEREREDVVNIALFGVDRRSSDEKGRSDSIMIATIDFKNDKLKLTSLMRDLYVPIDGHGSTKLNHAYAYGGAELAIKTINQNFDTNIRDYVTVDFFALEKIIDLLGGIEIPIKPEEVEYVNKYMKETASIQKKEAIPLKESGLQHLNGMQAVSYARIRYIGGDFERTERQRRVLTAMIDKVQKEGNSTIPRLLLNVMPLVETSLTRSDLLSLGYDYIKQQPFSMEQQRFPLDGEWESARINGGWYMKADLEKLKESITQYIYQDGTSEKPVDTQHDDSGMEPPMPKVNDIDFRQ